MRKSDFIHEKMDPEANAKSMLNRYLAIGQHYFHVSAESESHFKSAAAYISMKDQEEEHLLTVNNNRNTRKTVDFDSNAEIRAYFEANEVNEQPIV